MRLQLQKSIQLLKPKTKADGIQGSLFGSKGVEVSCPLDPLQNLEIVTPQLKRRTAARKNKATKKIGTAAIKHDTTTPKSRADDINCNHLGPWEPWILGTPKP